MKKTTLLLSLALSISTALCAEESIQKQFQNPPDAVKPSCYWMWFNTNVDKEGITRDLEEMKSKGLSGAYLYTLSPNSCGTRIPQGPDFLSPEWKELYRHALKEADRLGLELGINLGSGWLMGGPWTTPDNSSRWFLQSELQLTGPQKFSGTLPLPGPKDGYDSPPQLQVRAYINLPLEKVDYQDTAIVAFREPERARLGNEDPRRKHLAAKSNREDASVFTRPSTVTNLPLTPWAALPDDQPIAPGEVIDLTDKVGPEGKPVSYTIGNGTNLLRPNDPGPSFYLTTGTGADEKTIPFISSESKDRKLILTAEDKTRVTFAVNAGDRFISFRLEKIEDVPKDSEPVLHFMVNFQSGVYPETVTFDYMCLTGGRFETIRSYSKATWPYLWQRADNDPLGGFAFFVPQNDEEQNEALLRIWTEEKVPHPKIEGEWTYERAKQWAEEWKKNAEDTTHLMISAEKPEDLDPLIDYAKKLDAKRVYMHTDTWRGQYWVHDRDSLSVNTKVFPRGELS